MNQHESITIINNHFFNVFPCDSFGQTLHLQHPGKSANYLWWLCQREELQGTDGCGGSIQCYRKDTKRSSYSLMISLVFLIDLQIDHNAWQDMAETVQSPWLSPPCRSVREVSLTFQVRPFYPRCTSDITTIQKCVSNLGTFYDLLEE